MKVGDKVNHHFLGDGVITFELNKDWCIVKFKKRPPIKYNMGDNPCMRFTKELTLIK